MADPYFPQLSSGAIAHFPVRKILKTRTVANVLPSGEILAYPDDGAGKTSWSWEYVGITRDETVALQSFFDACCGPLKPFTFLDPVGNLLAANSNFGAPAWQLSPGVTIVSSLPSPFLNTVGMTLINRGQVEQDIQQTLRVPADYTYSFSVYVRSESAAAITLFRRSDHAEQNSSFSMTSEWRRVVSSGNLQDSTTELAVGIRISPGQQVSLAAAQLEAQANSSPYRGGSASGDVYPNAHWALEELAVRYIGPNECALRVSIEA
jgi:hypothetical protein